MIARKTGLPASAPLGGSAVRLAEPRARRDALWSPTASRARGALSASGTATILPRLLAVGALLKLRVNFLVLVTTFVGYRVAEASLGLGAPGGGVAFRVPGEGLTHLVHTLLATLCLGGGASALNQFFERDLDARMERTRGRPLPSGMLSAEFARGFGVLLVIAGIAWLALLVNPRAAAAGAATVVLYVFAYTPLKRLSTLSLLVGAVAGAMPPLIGWAAASGRLDGAAWSLFSVQFIWQVPHFLAIAWIYRDDYRRAGFRMLPVVDGDAGATTALQTVAWSFALLPASLAIPGVFRLGGAYFFFAALALGLGFVVAASVFAFRRTTGSARVLVAVSIAYLPLLFVALLAAL